MCCLSQPTSGYFAAISAHRSSHHGIEIEMPLLLVARVTCLRGRERASSNANFSSRSLPMREKIDVCATNSRSVPGYITPPTAEYSPSVFSRTMNMSMSPGLRPASGHGTPSNRRAGRRLMYWSKSRRNLISEPHSDTWSGTVAGQPTAPKNSASLPSSRCRQSSGIIWPVFAYQSQLAHSMCWYCSCSLKRLAAASSTRTPSGITSLPMPSPGITAMRKGVAMARSKTAGPRC